MIEERLSYPVDAGSLDILVIVTLALLLSNVMIMAGGLLSLVLLFSYLLFLLACSQHTFFLVGSRTLALPSF